MMDFFARLVVDQNDLGGRKQPLSTRLRRRFDLRRILGLSHDQMELPGQRAGGDVNPRAIDSNSPRKFLPLIGPIHARRIFRGYDLRFDGPEINCFLSRPHPSERRDELGISIRTTFLECRRGSRQIQKLVVRLTRCLWRRLRSSKIDVRFRVEILPWTRLRGRKPSAVFLPRGASFQASCFPSRSTDAPSHPYRE